LHEFHGEKSNWTDILSIHLIALAVTIISLMLVSDMGLALWQTCLLAILAYDLAGGVVANFSYSTNLYYDYSMKRRIVFLSLHFLQPVALLLVFPAYYAEILIFSAIIVFGAFAINAIKQPQKQLVYGVVICLFGIVMLQSGYIELFPALRLLFVIFFLKLPLSFSIRWYRLNTF